ncbi:unnamed protein product [Amoebophrya sp. A25]|nr:unnamed protein product [Amoebophrya sp. A25]|eukprot:GSA25T00002770001.1
MEQQVREFAERIAQLGGGEQLHLLLDKEEQNAEIIKGLTERVRTQNSQIQRLLAENMAVSKHLTDVQEALERMKSMANDRGIGQEVGKLVNDSGLNAYLCRKVFRRLYEDALKRIERKQERAKKLMKEKEENLAKTFAAQVEFTDTDCAFLRIRPLVAPTNNTRPKTADLAQISPLKNAAVIAASPPKTPNNKRVLV